MLGQPISHHHERKMSVRRGSVLVPRPCFRKRHGIGLLFGINRISDGRLKRLIVSWKRSVRKTNRDPDPSETIAMQEEGLVARQTVVAHRARWRHVVWRLRHREVGNVQARPFLTFGIPPYQLLALAPGLAVGTGRGAIVDYSPVGRPGEPPSMAIDTFGSTLIRPIFAGFGKDSGVYPTAASRRPIGFERREPRNQFAVCDPITVH